MACVGTARSEVTCRQPATSAPRIGETPCRCVLQLRSLSFDICPGGTCTQRACPATPSGVISEQLGADGVDGPHRGWADPARRGLLAGKQRSTLRHPARRDDRRRPKTLPRLEDLLVPVGNGQHWRDDGAPGSLGHGKIIPRPGRPRPLEARFGDQDQGRSFRRLVQYAREGCRNPRVALEHCDRHVRERAVGATAGGTAFLDWRPAQAPACWPARALPSRWPTAGAGDVRRVGVMPRGGWSIPGS
jgi:hypothetical protein